MSTARLPLADPLWSNDALALSAAIAEREVSCEEVVAAHLDRADEVEPSHHALVHRRARRDVLAEAGERDAELRRGERKGWLHGLPHAVKDLSDVRGMPTTWGLLDRERAPVASDDAWFVARLRAAGAVFIGKTNTSELGVGSHTYNTVAPTTRNAWDASRSAGGSSGGAAVSVALGIVPVADGSDFMGSLRNPPGWNAVLGLRPTPGRVPDLDDSAFTVPSGVAGPIARSARDLAALYATMAGTHDFLPFVRPGEQPPSGTQPRLGWLADIVADLSFDDAVLGTCRHAVRDWVAAGATSVDVALPPVGAYRGTQDLWPTWLTVRHREVGGAIARLLTERPGLDVKPEVRWEADGYRRLTVEQVDAARQVRDGLLRSALKLFEDVDVLVLPTAQVWPFAAELTWPREVGGRRMDTYHRWMEVTILATLAGLPVLVVPAGRGPQGLPMGLQLIGRPGGERSLLAWSAAAEAAGVFEVAAPHPGRR